MVRGSEDNSFDVDLTGAGLPATVNQPIGRALAAGQAANVLFIANNSGGNVSAAIGNLYPTLLTVSVAAAVPEPSIWVKMVLGFGMVGASVRRQCDVCVRLIRSSARTVAAPPAEPSLVTR